MKERGGHSAIDVLGVRSVCHAHGEADEVVNSRLEFGVSCWLKVQTRKV